MTDHEHPTTVSETLQIQVENVLINKLGECRIDSPLLKREIPNSGTGIGNIFACEGSRVLYHNMFCENHAEDSCPSDCDNKHKEDQLALELAGARQKIFFDPSKCKAGIVTCGGLCPGLNDVIRAVVLGLWNNYGVRHIMGFRYGYEGFISKYEHEVLDLDPDIVDGWQDMGGTRLGSSRGHQDPVEMVDCLERMGISMLFILGGDGTMRGALKIAEEIENRNAKISVIGIPKTIDNDIMFLDETFGFRTAVDTARNALRCAHVESKGVPHGVGLVKLMGRDSGFIACHAALAMSDVNYVLIPEQPFDIDAFLLHLKERLTERKHAVIAVAEGAGQDILGIDSETDASGNAKLKDIGLYLKEKINEFARENDFECNVKYFDPSYIIRSVPANGHDSTYCLALGHNAVHAAMAGKTEMLVGSVRGTICNVPMTMVIKGRKKVDLKGALWRMVLESTGQPIKF